MTTFAETDVDGVSSSRPDSIPNPTTPRKVVLGALTTDGNDGASAGDIPASTFGLNFIERVEPAVKSDNSLIVVCAPSYDGTSLLGKAAGSAAAADIPSGTYSIVLFGY